ncbi:MAG: PIN domain-containing protein [Candidatus Woesebacteria bacterium]|nr:PIN domain-containing protein [Candidatus Woesebacteria bacterium]
MSLPKYCFDTHPLVWYFRESKTLSEKAKLILDEAFAGSIVAFIPSIVLLEAFHLSLKDSKFVFSEFVDFLKRAEFIIIPLEEEVLKTCFELPIEINIHDRIVIATAKISGSSLVTKDKVLRSLFPSETIW